MSIHSDGDVFSDSEGIIRIDFSCAVRRVTLQAIPNDVEDPAWLRAYDSGGVQVDSDSTSGTTGDGIPEQVEVNAPNIAYITFAGDDQATLFFDDLYFECSGDLIPTVSQWGFIGLLLLIAAPAFWFIRRRKRTV